MNHSHLNPTIETLEDFLLANPSYQPVLASEQIGNNFSLTKGFCFFIFLVSNWGVGSEILGMQI